jgi:hypothetical protein
MFPLCPFISPCDLFYGMQTKWTGLQRASELALLGDTISPQKMQEWGIVNTVVPHDKLIPTALSYARKICQNSPDAVIVTRTGMLMSLERNTPKPNFLPPRNTFLPRDPHTFDLSFGHRYGFHCSLFYFFLVLFVLYIVSRRQAYL